MNMKIIRLWPVPCFLFCLYCLYTLVADSYEVIYRKGNGTDPLQFLACIRLSDLNPKKTKIDLKKLRGELYDDLKSSREYRYLARTHQERFKELILDQILFGDYLLLNRMFCLIANDRKELEDIDLLLSFKERVLFAMKNDTFDFIRMESPEDKIEQLIVQKMGRPYSDCDQSNRRFHCLNECFKRLSRLARYLYHANEVGSIRLDYSGSNRTVQESERTCFGQCKKENCKLVQMTSTSVTPYASKESKLPEIFESQLVLSAFDFWVEVIGLIFSFVGLFFDQFASTIIKLVRSRVRRKKVKVGLFYLNLAIILLSLTYGGYLGVRVALDQQAEANGLLERQKTRSLIQPKAVHLAICVPIDMYVNIDKKTMLEIETATKKALDNALKGIYLTYGRRSFQTDYQVHPKVLFKNKKRCFPLSIQLNYQTIPCRPKLTIKFKKYSEIFVLSEEKNLNDKSFEYGEFAFQKRILKRMKGRGGCVDYKEYVNCTGRQNCVERCIARKFIERYNRTRRFGGYTYSPVIDKDWFSQLEWNTAKMMKPDSILYPNIHRKCEEVLAKECDETKFEETVLIGKLDYQTREIDLQFDVVWSVEELPSSMRMTLDLLSIQSIFFGFTLLQLFWMVYQFTKPKWRVRNDKVVWFFICLLASVGCSWTTVHMLDVIVNGELVPIEHFEMSEGIQMPAMVFCFRINQKRVDRNHLLTGNYLEEMTRKINVESTFKDIAYLNESNEWAPFDLRRVERFFLLDMKCFRIHIDEKYDRNQFHFLNDTQVLKVNFSKVDVKYVHFMTQSNEMAEFSKALTIDYSSILSYRITHKWWLYKNEDRFGLFRRHFPSPPEGDVDDFNGQLVKLQSNEPNLRTLSLPLEEMHLDLEVDEDRFEQLYSAQQKKNRNKRTNLEYQQLFVFNHLQKCQPFKSLFFLDITLPFSESDFSFQLPFLQKVVHSTNEVNYATLTIALLNLLSLWLELGVLDLRPFFVRLHEHFLVYLYLHLPVILLRKLIKALLFCCRWLRKVEPRLYDLIDPKPTQPNLSLNSARRAQSAPVSFRSSRPSHHLPTSARPSLRLPVSPSPPQVRQGTVFPLQVVEGTQTTGPRSDRPSTEQGGEEDSSDDSSTSDQSSVI